MRTDGEAPEWYGLQRRSKERAGSNCRLRTIGKSLRRVPRARPIGPPVRAVAISTQCPERGAALRPPWRWFLYSYAVCTRGAGAQTAPPWTRNARNFDGRQLRASYSQLPDRQATSTLPI